MKKFVLLSVFMVMAVLLKAEVNKKIGPFTTVKVFGKVRVELIPSDEPYIRIYTADETIDLEKVTYKIVKEDLEINYLQSLSKEAKIEVEVGYQQLHYISVGGGAFLMNQTSMQASKMKLEALSGATLEVSVEADTLESTVSSGALLRVEGKSPVSLVNTSTGGDYRGSALESDKVVARLVGGSAEVNVQTHLDVKASFKAWLKYVALPPNVEKSLKMGAEIGLLEDF